MSSNPLMHKVTGMYCRSPLRHAFLLVDSYSWACQFGIFAWRICIESQRRTACSLEGIHIANDHRHMNELLVSWPLLWSKQIRFEIKRFRLSISSSLFLWTCRAVLLMQIVIFRISSSLLVKWLQSCHDLLIEDDLVCISMWIHSLLLVVN